MSALVDNDQSGIPSVHEYMSDYRQFAGIGNIPCWGFYIAFTMFRTVGIRTGIYERFKKGMKKRD